MRGYTSLIALMFILGMAAPPASAASLGSIVGGKTAVTVPFDHSKVWAIVSVLVNGKGPFPFILDSGAERNAIDTTFVQKLGLKTQGGGHITGLGSQKVGTLQTKNTTIQIGDAILPEQKFATFDFSDLKKVSGKDFVGILGANIFTNFVVQLDYKQSQLTLTLPQNFAYHGSGLTVPLTFDKHHIPQIEGKLEGMEGKFEVDTGNTEPLTLYTPFVETNHLRSRYASQIQTVTTVGAGGESKVQVVPGLLFQCGGFDAHLPVEMSQNQTGLMADKDLAGNIGGSVLQFFTVIFDYSRKQVIFEPRSDIGPASTNQESATQEPATAK